MNTKHSYRFPVLGITLILLGAGLLLDRLGYLSFGWDKILAAVLILYGVGLMARVFFLDEKNKVFLGTNAILFGAMILFTGIGWIQNIPDLWLPASMMILGLSFVMIFVMNMNEWGVLIPGLIFIAIGMMFGAAELGYWEFERIGYLLEMYWPLILILIGVSIILKRKNSRQKIESPELHQAQNN